MLKSCFMRKWCTATSRHHKQGNILPYFYCKSYVLQTNDGYIPSIKKPSGIQSRTKILHSTKNDNSNITKEIDGTNKETAKVKEQDCRPKLQRSALASDFFGHEYFYNGKSISVNLYSAERVNAFQDQNVQQLLESSRTENELFVKLASTCFNCYSVMERISCY
jgi:hypothetical protein